MMVGRKAHTSGTTWWSEGWVDGSLTHKFTMCGLPATFARVVADSSSAKRARDIARILAERPNDSGLLV